MPRRADRLRALVAKRRNQKWFLVHFAQTDPMGPKTVKPGEVRRLASQPGPGAFDSCAFAGRSEDGKHYLVAAPVIFGRGPTDEEIVDQIRAYLAAKVEAAKNAPKPPKEPKALGRVARTLAARSTVAEAKQQPAIEPTRLARCSKCRQRFEVPATEGMSPCPTCGTGI